MKTQEFNPRESITVFETVLFTNIVISKLRKSKIIDLAVPLMFISEVNGLDLFFSDKGILCSNANDYLKACSFLENSVMCN